MSGIIILYGLQMNYHNRNYGFASVYGHTYIEGLEEKKY